MKVFALDLSICNGCYCCQIACKDEHVGNDWTPYARPQPDTGQFWLKVQENIRGTVPKVRVSYIPQHVHALRRCAVHPGVQAQRDLPS